jgi:hypothetical protein
MYFIGLSRRPVAFHHYDERDPPRRTPAGDPVAALRDST